MKDKSRERSTVRGEANALVSKIFRGMCLVGNKDAKLFGCVERRENRSANEPEGRRWGGRKRREANEVSMVEGEQERETYQAQVDRDGDRIV